MHSGTRLLRNVILEGQDFTGFHTYEMDKYRKELNEGLIISPLRHPRRIAKSFKDRERKNTKWPYAKIHLDNQWKLMVLIDKFNPLYLHVDDEIKNKEIELISDAVEKDLVSDWTVCSRSGEGLGNHDIDLDDCPEAPQYQIDFYYETIERMNNLWMRRENLKS
jgi:hypothetical protein